MINYLGILYYEILWQYIFNFRISKIMTENNEYITGYKLHLSEYFMKLLYEYNQIIPLIIKRIILYFFNYKTQLIEYQVNNEYNKIISIGSLYKFMKMINKGVNINNQDKIYNYNLYTLYDVYLIKNKRIKLLKDILRYRCCDNKFIDVIRLILSTTEDLSKYEICFEKLSDDLLSTEKNIILLDDIKDKTIDYVLSCYC